jgi:hypothetical protein
LLQFITAGGSIDEFSQATNSIRFLASSGRYIEFYADGIFKCLINYQGLLVGGLSTNTPDARFHVIESTATTNAVMSAARVQSIVTGAGVAAAGFGTAVDYYAETATNLTNQPQGRIATSWIDATNASRKAKMSLSAYDTAARLGIEIEASGTAVMLGFFGQTTATQPAGIADADGTLADITTKFNSLIGKLETLGLIATV